MFRVMKRFTQSYTISFQSNIFVFEVSDWFYQNATKFHLIAEAIVENALVNDPRPTKKHPLRQFFPDLIDKTNLPDPLPSNLEDQVPKIFKDCKITAAELIDGVHMAINTVMCFESEVRSQWRFDKLVYYRYLVTTAVPWSLNSHYHIRDWWPVAAAAILESVVILLHCPDLLKTIIGHAGQQLYEIIMKHVSATITRVKGKRDGEYVKYWDWVDRMATPTVLPDLKEYLNEDPEAKYRHLMSQLKTHRDAEMIMGTIFCLEAACVYQLQIIEAKAPKKSSKGGQKVNLVGPVAKSKPYMAPEVYDAASALVHVSDFSFSVYFLLCSY